MSDANRQSFTDSAASKLKPDSAKSIPEKVADAVKSGADKYTPFLFDDRQSQLTYLP